jgi:antitoxin component YwqK of YwqJK toxin-antitoxin module
MVYPKNGIKMVNYLIEAIEKNNRLEGLYEAWFENEQLHVRCNYKNGIEDGLCEEWYENGNLRYKMLI